MEINVHTEPSSEKKVTLKNPKTGEKVVILPEIGAALVELELVKWEIFYYYPIMKISQNLKIVTSKTQKQLP